MADQLSRTLKDEYLVCRICLDQYRDPRRLSCDHVFCRNCIADLARRTHVARHFRNFVTCPLCRDEIEIHCTRNFVVTEWASSLPKDRLVSSLIETLNKHDSEKATKSDVEKQVCQLHGQKALEAYCLTHAHLVCWECGARDHSSCDTGSVSDASAKMDAKLRELNLKLRGQIAQAEAFSRRDIEFDRKKEGVLKEVDAFSSRLKSVYEAAMKQVEIAREDIFKADGLHVEQRRPFFRLVASMFEMEAELNDVPTAEKLTVFSKLHGEVDAAEKELRKIMSQTRNENIFFRPDQRVVDFLNSFSSIGFVDVDQGNPDRLKDANGLPCAGSNAITDSTPSSIAHILHRERSNEPSSEQREERINQPHVRLRKLQLDFSTTIDKEEISTLTGVLTHPAYPYDLFALDRENEKLKKFNLSGKLTDLVLLSGPPHDGCFIAGTTTICVTQPDEHLLTFIESAGLTTKRYVSSSVPYNGICSRDSISLVVSSWSASCIDVVDLHGNVLQHFPSTMHQCNPPNLLCSLPGRKVAVTEVGKTVMCIGLDLGTSRPVWQFEAPERVYGIAVDNNGSVYACVKETNEIRVIYVDGLPSRKPFLSEDDGLIRPVAISIHGKTVVVAEENGRIQIFREVE